MQHRRTKWVWTDGFSKWRLKLRMFLHIRMSAGRESSWWMEQQQKKCEQFGVHTRNDQQWSIGRAQSPRWCMGLYQLAEIRWSGAWVALLEFMACCGFLYSSHGLWPSVITHRGQVQPAAQNKSWVTMTPGSVLTQPAGWHLNITDLNVTDGLRLWRRPSNRARVTCSSNRDRWTSETCSCTVAYGTKLVDWTGLGWTGLDWTGLG